MTRILTEELESWHMLDEFDPEQHPDIKAMIKADDDSVMTN